MRNNRKLVTAFLVVVIVGVVGAGAYWAYKTIKYGREAAPAETSFETISEGKGVKRPTTGNLFGSTQATEEVAGIEKPLPEELNLTIPFYAQAPKGDWSMPWQEACEEASSLLVANIYGKKNWTRDDFASEILKLVNWEKERFGDYKHTDVEQTVKIFSDYLQLKTVVHTNPTFGDIQKILNKGHFIVAPFAGKRLHNPNFQNGGPNYHMLVIKGYTKSGKIVTADVGTRKGENFVYDWATIEDALHDYAEPIEMGTPRIIEVLPS